jgi:hypothetical protein
MKEIPYRYQIIRYVPDLERMEPQNIGVIVQGSFNVVSKIWTRFRPLGEKPDFDYANFRKWREFFDEEVNGPQISMFQPPRTDPLFLEYLQSRCKGNYILTHPLNIVMQTDEIEEVRDYLYRRLVKTPDSDSEPAEQPVRRFREQLQARKLHKNPRLRSDEYLELPNGESELFKWQYQRNHGSDQRILIEPIQWLDRIRLTQIELDHVLRAAEKVRKSGLNAQLIVVMDEVKTPSEDARPSTKHLYDNYVRGKEELKGLSDEVISSAQQSESLVARIEHDLQELYV